MSEFSEIGTHGAVRPVRGRLFLQPGEFVTVDDRVYKITEVVEMKTAVCLDIQTRHSKVFKVSELKPVIGEVEAATAFDLSELSEELLEEAMRRYSAIAPFLTRDIAGAQEVKARAEEFGVNSVTIYRWLKRYRSRNSMTALVRQPRGWKTGVSRLTTNTETVIEDVIENYFLTKRAPTEAKAVEQIRAKCGKEGIPVPSGAAIRARIARIPEEEYLSRRGKRKAARERFRPAAGTHPGGRHPLDVVQADHTKLDIIVLDDNTLKPIGRPYLTILICVYSRMITGYHLSLDPPGEASIGLAMAQSILPKEEWLLRHEVNADWPVWGFPRVLQVDNGADFRSDFLRRACTAHEITLEFCPVRRPNFKGTVERVYRTINKELHDLPGTTYSNVIERAEYDAEKEASMTLRDLERWLLNWICNIYHRKPHRTLVMSPLSRWMIGIYGDKHEEGQGPPALPVDRHTLQLDFTPMVRRTIQTTGVEVSGLRYYSEALRLWINRPHPSGASNQFIFRRDPSDLSKIWFFEPVLKQYFQVPLADQTRPPISLFELNRGKKLLKERGYKLKDATEGMIFEAALEGKRIVEESQDRSAAARRDAQRSRNHRTRVQPSDPIKTAEKAASQEHPNPVPQPATLPDDDDDDIRYEGAIG